MSGIIDMKQLTNPVKSLLRGVMLGDVWFLNGDAGDDRQDGSDHDHAIKTLAGAVKKTSSGNHDYILCYGAETGTAAIPITQADLHIIGIGNGGGMNLHQRGFQYTCPATVDTFQPSAAADGLEIAGVLFTPNATDGILIDDAGLTGGFFHHNTIKGQTDDSTDVIMLDIEGDQWVIADNIFWHCKLPVDLAAAHCYVARNIFQSQDTGAIGINIGATAHYGFAIDNVFNLGGGTGDTGIKIAASADFWTLMGNVFHGDLADNISDAGTDTFIVKNLEGGAITGTSGASLWLATED